MTATLDFYILVTSKFPIQNEKKRGNVQKGGSARPQGFWRAERTREVREPGESLRTQLAAFFNIPIQIGLRPKSSGLLVNLNQRGAN